jgi:hypothetical protein
MPSQTFEPIITPGSLRGGTGAGLSGAGGTMASSAGEKRTVVFTCDAGAETVPLAIFITGNLPELAQWTPNRIALRDDGTGGDEQSGDGVWTFRLDLPANVEIQYKYTNSGSPGNWSPGDELPGQNRVLRVGPGAVPLVLKDVFGKMN